MSVDPKVKPELQEGGSLQRSIGAHPIVFGVVVLGAFFALAFFLAIVPAVRALETGGTASVSDATARREAALATLDAENQVIDAVARISAADKARLAVTLPSEQDVPGMIVQLSSLATSAGVALLGMDLTVTDTKLSASVPSNVKTLDIALNVAGIPYERLKTFIANAEANNRLLDFHGITFTPDATGASVNFRAYFVAAP